MHIELTDFYSRLGTIVVIMILGFMLGKFKIIDTKINRGLVNLLLTVFMPASLFMAFPTSYNEATSQLFLEGLFAGILVMFMLILLSRAIFNKGLYKGQRRSLLVRRLPLRAQTHAKTLPRNYY